VVLKLSMPRQKYEKCYRYQINLNVSTKDYHEYGHKIRSYQLILRVEKQTKSRYRGNHWICSII